MLSKKIKQAMAGSSAIRAMFMEGKGCQIWGRKCV